MVGDRQIGEDRAAKIGMQQPPRPVRDLHQERPVEPEALPDALDIGRRRLIARDHRSRIAGRDEQQAEHEQRDHHHHRDGRQNAA